MKNQSRYMAILNKVLSVLLCFAGLVFLYAAFGWYALAASACIILAYLLDQDRRCDAVVARVFNIHELGRVLQGEGLPPAATKDHELYIDGIPASRFDDGWRSGSDKLDKPDR